MRITTLPEMAHALRATNIVGEIFPDNVRVLVELEKDEFDRFVEEVMPGKGGLVKRATKVKGYIESEILGIKVKVVAK